MRLAQNPPWPVELGGCPHCGRFAHVVYAGSCENVGCPSPAAPQATGDCFGTPCGVAGAGHHLEPCAVCKVPTVWKDEAVLAALCSPCRLAYGERAPTRAWMTRIGRPSLPDVQDLAANRTGILLDDHRPRLLPVVRVKGAS
ncbi:MAG TPA: hypothetical protein VHI93_01130 [Candidatus Thermoplasmatota archaeon]|nr:hypothetical protein [Candidatus Thermoplasmatota archaeon]